MKLVSFDPGKTTGFCVFQGIDVTNVGTKAWETEVLDWINELQADLFVVEDFLIQTDRLDRWNKGEALQVIGAIKARARMIGCPVVLQQPSVKPVAYKWLKMEYKKGKANMHHMDALVHGNYYLVRNGFKQPG